MLEGLFSTLNNPVPPVPPAKNQREPLEPANYAAVPLVPPVPPEKTKVKAEIKITAPAVETNVNQSITCKGCIHFESYLDHGSGAGTCKADVMSYGACWWADTVHLCDKYQLRDQAETGKSSEAAHNAQSRFFKFLITRPDGTQFDSCSIPRLTIEEVRAQFPDAAAIDPVTGEDYGNEG